MTRVLLISQAPIGERMAAPGIRYLELAAVLGDTHDVTLAAPGGSHAPDRQLSVYEPNRPASLRMLIDSAEVVISQSLAPRLVRGATAGGRRWIVDLINPEPFEGLEHLRHRPPRARKAFETLRIDRLAFALQTGTAFICASSRQRDMWLGFLAASRRLVRDDYDSDPQLERLIAVVPQGVPSAPPVPPPQPALRGRRLAPDARVMLWNGGVWNWLDAPTVVHALATLRARDPRWSLVFQGGLDAPRGTHVDNEAASRELRRVIDGYGFGADVICFDGDWTPYARRGDMLLEADVGVLAHRPSLEARFAFRNRLLDFVWARRPIVCTEGDTLAHEAAQGGWGEVVAPGDSAAFADAVERVTTRGAASYAPQLDDAARRYDWHEVARPLLRLIEDADHRGARIGVSARVLAARHGVAAGLARMIGVS
jgi:glycosyltransferase involved in cell wall biosynthesis